MTGIQFPYYGFNHLVMLSKFVILSLAVSTLTASKNKNGPLSTGVKCQTTPLITDLKAVEYIMYALSCPPQPPIISPHPPISQEACLSVAICIH